MKTSSAVDADKRAPLLANKDGGNTVELVPPDGGWGWMVVLATALSNVIMYPIFQTFTLVYKDTFASIGMTATDITFIINVNSAFGMSFGLFHGLILKKFGYRKVAILASAITFVGVLATSFGNSFSHFFVAYGLITSFGESLLVPSFSLALSSYFKERRGKAMGLAMTLTGIGPTVMPLLLSQLLSLYGVSGTGLIASALSLHNFVGAMLLQPIKWHMRPRVSSGHLEDKTTGEADVNATNQDASTSVTDPNRQKQGYNWWSVPSVDSVHLGSSVTIFDEKAPTEKELAKARQRKLTIAGPIPEEDQLEMLNKLASGSHNDRTQSYGNLNSYAGRTIQDYKNAKNISSESSITVQNAIGAQLPTDKNTAEAPEEQKAKKTWLKRMSKEMDLSLLKDSSYVNLLVGMSIAITAEYNFSMLTPLIFADLGFSDNQIALTMSTMSAVDIVFRFLSPFFADYMQYSAKTMYLISMFLLITSRTTVLFFTTFFSLMMVCMGLGVAKGVRTVYMSLVIPNYVPLDKLATASGMQMVLNAVFLLTCGPFIGYVRDVSGSYNACINVINSLTLITMTMWLSEIVYKRCKAKCTSSAA